MSKVESAVRSDPQSDPLMGGGLMDRNKKIKIKNLEATEKRKIHKSHITRLEHVPAV